MRRADLLLCLILAAAPAAAQPSPAWHYRPHVTPDLWDRLLILTLSPGAGGDDLALIRCPYAPVGAVIDLTLASDVRDTHDGATVALAITAPGLSRTLAGSVMRTPGWVQGVMVSLSPDDPLWEAMMAVGAVQQGRPGHPPQTTPLAGFAEPARRFLADCRAIADLPADLPEPTQPSQPGAHPTKHWRDDRFGE